MENVKFDLNYKMFGESQAKILWRFMGKLYPTFQSPYSLHKPPQTILVHTFFLSVSEFVVKNIRKHLLFSRSFCVKTLPWQKQLIPASFYLKSISSLLISATLLYLSNIPSCISAVGKETSEPETSYCLWWKFYCSPHQVT